MRRSKSAPTLDAKKVRITANPDGTMTLKGGGRTWKKVRVRLGRPLFRPDEFAAALEDGQGESALLVNLPALEAKSKAALETHRLRHNLTCKILKVNSLAHQFGSAFWDVETEKGPRQFVIRGTSEHVRWLSDDRLLITDVHHNRFEVPSITGLDRRSQGLISLIL